MDVDFTWWQWLLIVIGLGLVMHDKRSDKRRLRDHEGRIQQLERKAD